MEKIIRLPKTELNCKWIASSNITEDKPILVFLHEALGSIPQWKTFPADLCNACICNGLVYERSGHGKSSTLTQTRTIHYLHEYEKELTLLLAETLPLGKKYLLVGHSDGGSIALIHASRKPKNLVGIVTIAAHTFVESETLAGITPAVKAFREGKLVGLNRFHGEKTETLFWSWANTWKMDVFQKWDIRNEIQHINCPTLSLQGTKDQYGTKLQLESIDAIGDHCETELIPNCGHHPHLEVPKIIIDKIVNWHSKIN